ncbi:MAG: DUF1704 domain-containing protein [Eudoraea sp.]|nr:DUF1704 domain-containing protein [Eudoraea sp.]
MRQHSSQSQLQKQYAKVFELDSNLDRLVRRIELLSYVNPINIEKEKQRFFASKYSVEPQFKYPKIKFDPLKLQRLFFSQRPDRLEDPRLEALYRDVIYFYSNMVQCISSIGTVDEFYYNSLRVYGTPTEKDVQNAQFILHFEDEPLGADMEKIFTAVEAKEYFEDFADTYDFPLQIKFATHIAADAMVSNINQTLFLKRNAMYSKNQLLTLANHEIGVHLVTTFNGLAQPLKIFANGFPKNVETQEGLCMVSEYKSGALTLKRLKELSHRVLASDGLSKGYDFKTTFDLIHNQYKLNRNEAFTITLRAHRGGGFTKDRLYLSGLKKVYDIYKSGASLDLLLTGKVSIDYLEYIKYLGEIGLLVPNIHKNHAFEQDRNTNKTLDFILQNLS